MTLTPDCIVYVLVISSHRSICFKQYNQRLTFHVLLCMSVCDCVAHCIVWNVHKNAPALRLTWVFLLFAAAGFGSERFQTHVWKRWRILFSPSLCVCAMYVFICMCIYVCLRLCIQVNWQVWLELSRDIRCLHPPTWRLFLKCNNYWQVFYLEQNHCEMICLFALRICCIE